MIRNLLSYPVAKKKVLDYSVEYAELTAAYETDTVDLFQKKKLEQLITHAKIHSPYYKKFFSDADTGRDDNSDLSVFYTMAPLTKEMIRANLKNIYSDDYPLRQWYFNSSGGSTGEPLRFIQDITYTKWGNAMFRFYYTHYLGIDEPFTRKMILWGAERDLFQGKRDFKRRCLDWLNNTVFLNSFLMTEEDMAGYVKKINSFKPVLLRGYAGSLYELSKYIRRERIPVFSPEIIVSAAETLHPDMREEIESVFGRKVYDFYGSREIGSLAGECRNGNYHTLFWNFFEVLDTNNNPVKEGEEGRVIVTNLFNYSMPLLRYEIGDMAIRGPDSCACGQRLPTLRRITGRITDHFKRNDGSIIHGEYFTHLFYLKDWVSSFQVIQEDYEKIRILVVKKSEIDPADTTEIEMKIRLVLGKNCTIVWDLVDQIPKTKTGKYLFTKSEIR